MCVVVGLDLFHLIYNDQSSHKVSYNMNTADAESTIAWFAEQAPGVFCVVFLFCVLFVFGFCLYLCSILFWVVYLSCALLF